MFVSRSHDGTQSQHWDEMTERRKRCENIAAKVRAMGFDVTWERVNRHYAWFTRWDEGRLATGYLIRRTGIRRKAQRPEPETVKPDAVPAGHGKRSAYVKGCRCRPCTTANAEYSIRQRWAQRGITVEWPPKTT